MVTRNGFMQETAEILRCVSCGKRIEAERDWVRFTCPNCGEAEILRCERCKKLVNFYRCPKCNFEGP